MVEADFFPILSLFSEVDMFTEWVPTILGLGLKSSDMIERKTPTNMCISLKIKLPPPFSNRNCVFRALGHDCMTKDDQLKQVVVLLDSISEEEE